MPGESTPASPAASWFNEIGAAAAACAETALQLGNEAAVSLGDRVAGVLARLQGLPAEAQACVDELAAAIGDVFGQGEAPAGQPAGSGPAGGQAGGFAETGRVAPQLVPRRFRVDAPAFAAFIRQQHPHKPAEHAAAATGIALDSMEKMLARQSLPNGPNFLRCVAAYGPGLLAAVLPEADERWLAGALILADQARLEAELAATRAAMAANTGRWVFCGVSFGGAP